MMRTTAAAAAVAAFVIAASPAALAQTAQPDSENGRYSFNQIGDELMRLDSRTGQVSMCSRRDVGWACLMVPDERAALEAEIARLQNENVALKRELISRGVPLPGGARAPEAMAPKKTEEPTLRLPSDAEIDQVTAFLEKVWRRLVDMVQTTRKDNEKEPAPSSPPAPVPQKGT